jgi:hypothetical protein
MPGVPRWKSGWEGAPGLRKWQKAQDLRAEEGERLALHRPMLAVWKEICITSIALAAGTTEAVASVRPARTRRAGFEG